MAPGWGLRAPAEGVVIFEGEGNDSFHIIASLANAEPEIRRYRVTEQEGCRPATLSIERAYRGRGTPRCS